MSSPEAPLSKGTGYGTLIGLGVFFAVVVVGLSQALRRYGGLSKSSSEYSIANRSLGIGLSASAVTSSWCWSVTLLSACSTAYNYGVAGALIYGAANMVQITLFSAMAIQLKRRAPTLHTHLELLKIRYGTAGHLTFLFFALATNILVVSSILVGAAAAINSIAGVNVYASLFILPTAVAAYTLTGGLRSTILADYLHTFVIFIIIFVLFFKTYATSDLIGSPTAMYNLLQQAAAKNPSDNYQGSFLTLKSLGAIKFAWLSFLEYLGVVFNDASFHQKGIAANPSATVPGYVVGSLSWFTIPWTLATTAGLVALALETVSPTFPTFPNRMTSEEVSAGLVLPYAAQAILGKGGSAAVLLLMFMSSTSAISSQLIAVSSISGYDLYKTYFNRTASPDQILRVQQWGVIAFSLFMAAFGSLLHGVGVDLAFLYNITGVWSTAALPQIVFSFFGDRLPTWAVFPGIWIGFGAGLAVWLSLAKRIGGSVSLASLEIVDVDLYTFTTCIATGILICTIGSLLTPKKIDWQTIWQHRYEGSGDEKEIAAIEADQRFSDKNLKKWLFISGIASVIIFCVFLLIWPLSLYRDYIFTSSFFYGWVVVSGIWAFLAFFAVGLFPIVEGIPTFRIIAHNILYRLGKRDAPDHGIEREQPEEKGARQLESSGSSGTGTIAQTGNGENGHTKESGPPSPTEKKPEVAGSTTSY